MTQETNRPKITEYKIRNLTGYDLDVVWLVNNGYIYTDGTIRDLESKPSDIRDKYVEYRMLMDEYEYNYQRYTRLNINKLLVDSFKINTEYEFFAFLLEMMVLYEQPEDHYYGIDYHADYDKDEAEQIYMQWFDFIEEQEEMKLEEQECSH